MLRIAKSAVGQVGVFVFLESLVLFPGACATTNGIGLSSVLPLVALLATGEIAYAAIEARRMRGQSKGGSAQGNQRFASIALPLAALLLSVCAGFAGDSSLAALSAPLAFAAYLCLGFALLAHIHLFARNATLDSQGLFLSASASILISGVYLVLVRCAGGGEAIASGAALAIPMAISGLALAHCDQNNATLADDRPTVCSTAPSREAKTAGISLSGGNLARMFPMLVPMMLEVLLCATSLGINSESGQDANPIAIAAGLGIYLAFTVLSYHQWKKTANVTTLVMCGAVVFSIPIALSVAQEALDPSVAWAFALLSHALFLLLIWTNALMIGRIDNALQEAAPLCMAAFMLIFGISAMLEQNVDMWAKQNAMSLCALAFLLYLIWLFGAGSKVESKQPADAPRTADEVLREHCNLLAREYSLSPREAEVLPLLAAGLSSTVIANRMMISPGTVKTHRHRIYMKVGVRTHEELIDKLNLLS